MLRNLCTAFMVAAAIFAAGACGETSPSPAAAAASADAGEAAPKGPTHHVTYFQLSKG